MKTKTKIPESLKARATELAEEHWDYNGDFLEYALAVSNTDSIDSEAVFRLVEFAYGSAFIHGYKHAFEDQHDGVWAALEKSVCDV